MRPNINNIPGTCLQQPDAIGREDLGGEAVEERVQEQGQDEAREPLLGLGVVVEAGLCISSVCNVVVLGVGG